jgi:hypothetical protein
VYPTAILRQKLQDTASSGTHALSAPSATDIEMLEQKVRALDSRSRELFRVQRFRESMRRGLDLESGRRLARMIRLAGMIRDVLA